MKLTYLVDVEVDLAEHNALNDQRHRLGKQQQSLDGSVENAIIDSLAGKVFSNVMVARAEQVKAETI